MKAKLSVIQLTIFLSGLLSGLIFFVTGIAYAATFNVSSVSEFRSALTQAQNNGSEDVITLASGTYSVSAVLTYTSPENTALEIVGEDRETCILDGNGTTQILSVFTSQPEADVRIRNLTFRNGSTSEDGGALNVGTESADVNLENCRIADSETTGDESVGGGAVCTSQTGTVTVESCTFFRNMSYANVGGLYVATASGTGRIIGCHFEENAVNNTGTNTYFGDGGGAMFSSEETSQCIIRNNAFTGNTVSGGDNPDGGGLMTYQLGAGSTLTVDNNLFRGNHAGLGGGGCILRFNNTDNVIEVTDNRFEENVTDLGSGAGLFLYINDADLTYTGNIHVNNAARGNVMGRGAGAEINHKSGQGQITDNIFTSNQAENNGGGLSLPTETANMTVTRNIFNANTASNVGGGISYSTSSGTLLLSRNTWYGNQAGASGGGLYVYLDETTAQNTFRNNIFRNDSPDELDASTATGPADLVITYSDIQDGSGQSWFGTGCIDADPLFTNPANGDFSLSTNSPCIDTGDPSSPEDPDGSRADMGALPYTPKGDMDGDGLVQFEDYSVGAEVMSGITSTDLRTDYEKSMTDVDGDGVAGFVELLYILQQISVR